jgi:hypothetical protein
MNGKPSFRGKSSGSIDGKVEALRYPINVNQTTRFAASSPVLPNRYLLRNEYNHHGSDLMFVAGVRVQVVGVLLLTRESDG